MSQCDICVKLLSQKKKRHIIIVSLKANNTPTCSPCNGTLVDSKRIFRRSMHVVLRCHVPTETIPISICSSCSRELTIGDFLKDITSLQHPRHTWFVAAKTLYVVAYDLYNRFTKRVRLSDYVAGLLQQGGGFLEREHRSGGRIGSGGGILPTRRGDSGLLSGKEHQQGQIWADGMRAAGTGTGSTSALLGRPLRHSTAMIYWEETFIKASAFFVMFEFLQVLAGLMRAIRFLSLQVDKPWILKEVTSTIRICWTALSIK